MDELQYQVDLLTLMNQKLKSSERMYRKICDTSPNAYIYYYFAEDKMKTNGKWNTLFDFNLERFRDITKLYECVDTQHISKLRDAVFCEKLGLQYASAECRISKDNVWFECETTIFLDEMGAPKEKVIRFYNITTYKRQKEELSYLAYYDMSTGLYNRNYFVRILADLLEKAKQEKAIVSLLFMDIDDFRKINDGLGILAGDELVQLFGAFLKDFQDENVIVSHFNSDVFCIAVYDPTLLRNVDSIYRLIRERVRLPFQLIEGYELNISISAGVAEYPESGQKALELINNAEIVMFKAKYSGKNDIQYFDEKILTSFLENVEIEHKLRDALHNNALYLEFQPQYECEAKLLRGVEALLRWKDYHGNLISPAIFVPIAEKNGTIVPIGNWVLDESLRQYSEWKNKYQISFMISVNISTIQYKRDDFVPQILKLLKKYQVKPSELELEITESILIEDFEQVAQKMRSLQDFGVKVSLDDFGTGFSSLSYLNGLPIDTLKIDKSFVDRIVTDDGNRIMIESIITMVKKLGFETIAEGVETKEQFDYLKTIDCDNIQGFYLGRPMSAAKIDEILNSIKCSVRME